MIEPTAESPSFFDPQHPFAHIGQKILIAVTLLAGVIFYYVARYSKGQEVVQTFLAVKPILVIGMLAAETAYVFFQGCFMCKVYRCIGFKRSILYTSCMYLAMNLVNTIAPVAGLSGSIYMMHHESGKGLHRSDTALINFLYYLTDYAVFLAVLLLGLAYLFWVGEITKTILITSMIFAGFVFLVGFIGIFMLTHETALLTVMQWFNRLTRHIHARRKSAFTTAQVHDFVAKIKEAWRRSKDSSRQLMQGSFYAFCLHLSSMLLLWLAFKAVHVHADLQMLVAGYTVGTLLNIVSVTPGGIGFAEGGMTAVFSALGVPVEQALLISLLYRTVFVWYPLALGLLSLHSLPLLASKEAAGEVY